MNNHTCADFNMDRFKIIKSCGNMFGLIKLEAICILVQKPKLCRQKEFHYIVSLFTECAFRFLLLCLCFCNY